MIEIVHSREKGIFKNMPQEVQETIERILEILDTEYGVERNKYEDDGGYVVVVEKIEDFDVIKELIQWRIGDEDYADFGEQIKAEDYFSINNTLFTFSNGFKNEYKLVSVGYISPGNGDEDTISINLYKGDKLIEEGCINIYYGFIEYDDDGNVGDGAEEDIAVNINKLLSQLIDIKEDIIKELNIRTTKFQSLIEMLS